MAGSSTQVEALADEIVQADVAVDETLPAWSKATTAATGIPFVSGRGEPAATGRDRTSLVVPLVGIGAAGLIAALGAIFLFGGQPTPTATFAVAPPTATPPATEAATNLPSTPTPTRQPTEPPTEPPTDPPTEPPATAEPTVPPSLADSPAVRQAVAALSNDTVEVPEGIATQTDGTGDTYLPHDGSPATADQPWIDYIGAAGFLYELEPGPAAALSSHACGSHGERDGVLLYAACNQSGPMRAGEYVVVVMSTNSALPDPFPDSAQCAYIVQSDVDGDRSTGFQSPLEFNHLTGADVYFENIFFWDQQGEFRNYILGTDHAQPVRPDTNEIHGNLATFGRWFGSNHEIDGGNAFIQTAWIPAEQLAGDSVSVGGFCTADLSSTSPDRFSVDALGDPANEVFPDYFEVVVAAP